MSTSSVSFVAPSAYVLGGVATWLDELVPALRARGWRVNMLLTDGRFHRAPIYEQAHRAIVPARYVRNSSGSKEGRLQALAKALRECDSHAVVSVNVPDAMLAVARVKRVDPRSAMRAIMSIHGLEADLFADVEQLAPLLDGVICSNRLAQLRARMCTNISPERVHYAPYGTQLRPPRPIHDSRPMTIGFAGRFDRFQKRVQDLAPIARALLAGGTPHRWLIAGDGPDRESIDALANITDLSVHCLGHVDAAHMQKRFYEQCDVLLNTSEWETGPIVVWEAMANDVAVVSSTYVGSGREAALSDGENCLLYPVGDIERAAKCLTELTAAARRKRITDAARQLLCRRYTPSLSCESWARAIDELSTLAPALGAPLPVPAHGRLDRWFGTAFAHRLRILSTRSFQHREAGGEWPHTLNPRARDDPEHWRTLTTLDDAQNAPPQESTRR